jgi:hypothetical protein
MPRMSNADRVSMKRRLQMKTTKLSTSISFKNSSASKTNSVVGKVKCRREMKMRQSNI